MHGSESEFDAHNISFLYFKLCNRCKCTMRLGEKQVLYGFFFNERD
ncbi:hypothetical protein BACUNI_01547 [Bacteroides uniformis ATCC 8492]|uniref:Uncharacterized protein n=1 Tax=Bacteroides uniformis (strain ATCC 8492 / DSM 6597 / CCUG 4942 / CIP 103695 / JCM 5828 / KCTC 5204 / NCTC 13054 / VPI 0061) TaxID=411479 RepID=A0ABC9NCY9_BACUC|nr:hypothetical protein BACUNI_01547 [Bacteroides uniformis ATCC 8492]